eukprot:UN07331
MLSISTLGNSKFSDLFAALSIPRVLNIQNLQLQRPPLRYLSYGIDDLYIVTAFLIWHHFRDKQKQLLSVQAFTAKAWTHNYCSFFQNLRDNAESCRTPAKPSPTPRESVIFSK